MIRSLIWTVILGLSACTIYAQEYNPWTLNMNVGVNATTLSLNGTVNLGSTGRNQLEFGFHGLDFTDIPMFYGSSSSFISLSLGYNYRLVDSDRLDFLIGGAIRTPGFQVLGNSDDIFSERGFFEVPFTLEYELVPDQLILRARQSFLNGQGITAWGIFYLGVGYTW